MTTDKIADGAVTPEKLSNDATEANRIVTWLDDIIDYSFDATGNAATHMITTNITLTVPSGKAYYYLVMYDGGIMYSYAERSSSNGFYGAWSASIVANTTEVSPKAVLVQTGYRQSWEAVGGSAYWQTAYHANWPVRLTEGTHILKIQIFGYSDNTMNFAHFRYNHLQAVRLL